MVNHLLAGHNDSRIVFNMDSFLPELLDSDLFGLEKLEEIHFHFLLFRVLRIRTFVKILRRILRKQNAFYSHEYLLTTYSLTP